MKRTNLLAWDTTFQSQIWTRPRYHTTRLTVEIRYRFRRTLGGWVNPVLYDVLVKFLVFGLNELHRPSVGQPPALRDNDWTKEITKSYVCGLRVSGLRNARGTGCVPAQPNVATPYTTIGSTFYIGQTLETWNVNVIE